MLPLSLAPNWTGIKQSLTDGTAVAEPDAGSDYARACSRTGCFTLPVGCGEGIVYSEEPFSATWLASSAGAGGCLVGYVYGPGEEMILSILPTAMEQKPFDAITIDMSDHKYIIFDSAIPGTEVEDVIELKLLPGRNQVTSIMYEDTALALIYVYSFEMISRH